MMAKKYYWLKLMEGFFEEDTIAWLEEQENGVYYTNFYLKLCLKSLKTNGILIRNVGEILIPYDIKKLSEITHVKLDTAIVAMELFKKIGLVEILENGEIYLTQLELMVGSETNKAQLMRRKRAREKESRLGGYGNNVTHKLPSCYSEKDIDTEKEKDKETDIEIEQDIEIEKYKTADKRENQDKEAEKKSGQTECLSKRKDSKAASQKKKTRNKKDSVVPSSLNSDNKLAEDNDDHSTSEYKALIEMSQKNLNVYKHFEKCGFLVTSHLLEFISNDIEKYGEEWLMKAAEECVKRGKSNNYGYLKGILENWKNNGNVHENSDSCRQNAMAYEPLKSILYE